MLRMIVKVEQRATADGSVFVGYETFDIDCPALEKSLRRGGYNEDGTFLLSSLSGVELLNPEAAP